MADYEGKLEFVDHWPKRPSEAGYETAGYKLDQGKLDWTLLDADFLEACVRVLAYGANKYSRDNWRKGMAYSRPFSAAMRHLWAFWRGESVDPETGLSHLAHAFCNLQFLFVYVRECLGKDDRPLGPRNEVRGQVSAELADESSEACVAQVGEVS